VDSLPPLPIPEDLPPPPEPLMPINPISTKPKKRRRILLFFLFMTVLGAAGVAAYCYQDTIMQAVQSLG